MRPFRMVVCVIAIVASASACRPAGDPQTGSDDIPGENVVGQTWEDGIPMYPESEALGTRTERAGVITQSFATTQVAPDTLMSWYQRELARDGWEVAVRTRSVGDDAFRGDWVKERAELRVSASPSNIELEEMRGVEEATQFNLTYEPAD